MVSVMSKHLIILAALGCLSQPAFAQSQAITVQNAWARATSPSQKVGGVFLTLTDHGPADRLLSATSPMGDMVELHETIDDSGVMKMRPVPALPIASGETVVLKPGGYHLMVMGLKHALAKGSSFPLTLTFEHAGPVTVSVSVDSAGASGPMMDHGAMPMGGMKMAPMKP